MNYLSGIVKCSECGKNFNIKKNGNKFVYVCQTKKNYGKSKCDSPTIHQDYLLSIIETHLHHLNKDYAPTKIKLFVKSIIISNERIKILYKDGTYSEIKNNSIRF